MPLYQVRVRDEAGDVIRTAELELDDDQQAIEQLTLEGWASGAAGVELWRGERCVIVAYVSDEPLEEAAEDEEEEMALN